MHLCFVMPGLYPLLAGIKKPAGGSETLMWHLSRSLYGRGHRVTILAGDYGQPSLKVIDGIETLRVRDGVSPIKGWRTVRMVAHTLHLLNQLRPDVVIHMNFGFEHGLLASYCRLARVHYLYFTASMADVDGTRYRRYPRWVAWLWLLGMKLCPSVVVQTEEHRESLRRNFARDSVVIPNGIDPERFRRVRQHGTDVLWVGNWREVKRPDLVGDVARRLPMHRFVMCGGTGDRDLFERVRPNLPDNVVVRGYTDAAELIEAYQNAAMLINTSDFEGIPVTFDEAWACELPVVSLNVDPDGIILRNGLGYVSRSPEQMARDISLLCSDVAKVIEIGQRGRQFVDTHHSVRATSKDVERLLIRNLSRGDN